MYCLDSNIQHYGREIIQVFEPLNHDPVRFNFLFQSGSTRNVAIPPERLSDALEHLVNNAMAAVSGLGNMSGVDIMRNWKPDTPGEIILRTRDSQKKTIVEIEDNGCGINPLSVAKTEEDRHYLDITTDYEVINAVFETGFSTKGSGGGGLTYAWYIIEREHKGKIYVAGTTYSKNGKIGKSRNIVTIGEHHGKSIGTIFRIELPFKRKK